MNVIQYFSCYYRDYYKKGSSADVIYFGQSLQFCFWGL